MEKSVEEKQRSKDYLAIVSIAVEMGLKRDQLYNLDAQEIASLVIKDFHIQRIKYDSLRKDLKTRVRAEARKNQKTFPYYDRMLKYY